MFKSTMFEIHPSTLLKLAAAYLEQMKSLIKSGKFYIFKTLPEVFSLPFSHSPYPL